MLKLYYGRENVDKDKYMFDKIAKSLANIGSSGSPKRIFLLVPDQYTLQTERNAFTYLKVKGLIDLEVLSQNRLAAKVLDETGGSSRVHIDKHGRYMLLSKIIAEEDKNLQVFKGMGESHSFINMTNNLISEMKQYNTNLSSLAEIIEEIEEKNLLYRKLLDIYRIYEKYENQIADKYIDTEDYINLFASKISQSELIKDTEFWISGFDQFTPKLIRIVVELINHSKGVNVILTADDYPKDAEIFNITKDMMAKLEYSAGDHTSSKIRLNKPMLSRTPALDHLERELFAYPYKAFKGGHDDITFCRAANFYSEAETAATYISRLIREEGLRYRDIAVICNDMETRGTIIKRVFEEYDISFFLDQKRKILHNPAIVFITALLDVITEGWLYEDVFRLLKTGFCPVCQDDYESLENYAIRYKIYGRRWSRDFRYGIREYGDDLNHLNQVRKDFTDFIHKFEESLEKANTVREKTAAIYTFLREQVGMPGQIERLIDDLDDDQKYDTALEMSQIWESIIGLFDQLIELIGDEEVSDSDYASMLGAGFESVEVGLIPSTIDQVVVGTMQRTRVGKIKALIVIGANDGILPAAPIGDDLLSQDERAILLRKNIEICKDDDHRVMEERLAIYKNLSRPERYLWIGYSVSDLEGKEIRPSIILNKLRRLFPDIQVEKDILNTEEPLSLIERPSSSLKHMTEALRKTGSDEEELPEAWKAAYNWYHNRGDKGLSMVKRGLFFTNKLDKLEVELVKKLFQKTQTDLTLSPSRLEKFARCPFSHLVLYGLAPEERRIFEVAGREVGDVYHECLMRLSDSLTIKGMDITDEKSPWMNLAKEQCEEKVGAIIDKIALEYREGMLTSGEEERYRTSRMKEVCGKAAWALITHVQQGRIKDVFFEGTFGSGDNKEFPPISIAVGDQVLSIEGKIDRVDVLPGGYIKVIDYKSGKERFDIDEVKGGWRLQLMLYLKAAIQGMEAKNQPAEPAGVFYFEIADPLIDASVLSKEALQKTIENNIRKAFKLDGIVIDNPSVIENIAGDFSGHSEILPLRKNKDGIYSGTTDSKLLKEEEFEVLRSTLDNTISELCTSLASGVIDIHPKKTKYETACKFCEYKSICNFELSFDGCSYDVIK